MTGVGVERGSGGFIVTGKGPDLGTSLSESSDLSFYAFALSLLHSKKGFGMGLQQ